MSQIGYVFAIFLMFLVPSFTIIILIVKLLYKRWVNWGKDAFILTFVPVLYSTLLDFDIGKGKSLSNVIVEPLLISLFAVTLFIQKSIYEMTTSVRSTYADVARYFMLIIFVVVIVISMPGLSE